MTGPAAQRTVAVDDYIKAIYACDERGEGPATTTGLARRLGVGASSVSGMLRKLAEQGFIEHRPYGGVRLTADGTVATFSGRRFATLEPGDHGRLVRVDDTEPAMLTWLREQSIALDVRLELVSRRPFGGPFLVRVSDGTAADAGREIDLGPELADSLWVDDVVEGVFHRTPAT
jgi:hypothetical protein